MWIPSARNFVAGPLLIQRYIGGNLGRSSTRSYRSPLSSRGTLSQCQFGMQGNCPGMSMWTLMSSSQFCGSWTGADRTSSAICGIRPSERRSEEHTSELQSLMRISYAVFCLKKKNKNQNTEDESDRRE